MREGWEKVALGEIAVFRNGLNFSNSSHGKGCLIIGIPDFQDRSVTDYDSLGEIDPEGIVKADDYLKVGDVIFVRSNGNKALVGRSMIITRNDLPLVYSGFCIRARFNSNAVDPRFYAHFFRTSLFRELISAASGGANIQNLNQGILGRSIVPFPPLPTQRKIASILSAYDDLIENNLQRIKLLEELAQRTYQEWFVKFRVNGVDLEVDPASRGHGAGTGLPGGWEIRRADELFDIKIGKTPPREQEEWFREDNAGIKWASIRDINRASVFIQETSERITEEGVKKFNMNVAKKGTVILSFKLTVGKVTILSEDMVTNEAIAHFNMAASSPFSNGFLYCQLISFNFDSLGSTSSIGTAINSKIVKAMPLLVPDRESLSKFNEWVGPIFTVIENLQNQNHLLKESRDILLPRMMSGEVEV